MNIYADGHCDTLKKAFDIKKDLKYSELDFNIKDIELNIPRIQTLAAFVNTCYEDGFKRAKNLVEYYDEIKDETFLIKNVKDIEYVCKNNKLGVILSIENGKAIENDLKSIDWFYEKGIRMMGITWNDDNLIGCSCLTQKDIGLTDFGIEYVKKLESKNIIIDVSHCSEKTFWDTYNNTNKTLVASHSCCFGICSHKRNLKDEQIKAIAKRRGIVGICFANKFLSNNSIVDVNDILKHIDYIINLVGEDYVGLGSDFDGLNDESKLKDICNVSKVQVIEETLIKNGYSQDTIDKIMGKNWIRVFSENLEE